MLLNNKNLPQSHDLHRIRISEKVNIKSTKYTRELQLKRFC